MLKEDRTQSSAHWALGSNEFPTENLLSDPHSPLPLHHCAFVLCWGQKTLIHVCACGRHCMQITVDEYAAVTNMSAGCVTLYTYTVVSSSLSWSIICLSCHLILEHCCTRQIHSTCLMFTDTRACRHKHTSKVHIGDYRINLMIGEH